VAGDLFVKNMDWPGAEEMAERLRKTIDPKVLADQDEDPALQAAQQQMQAMGQEMDQMHQMLQNVSQSMEAQKLKIDEYNAETKRISAVASGMNPEQVQEVVMQTLRDVMTAGDMVSAQQAPEMPIMPEQMQQMQQMQPMPEQMPQQGQML
jgi:methyl-accepting chemotaxis protein